MSEIQEAHLTSKDLLDHRAHEVELILTLTVIVWIANLTEDLGSFEVAGWVATLFLILLICEIISAVKEISNRGAIDSDIISYYDYNLETKFEYPIILGFFILLAFCLVGSIYFWSLNGKWNWIFVIKGVILSFTWIYVPSNYIGRMFYN